MLAKCAAPPQKEKAKAGENFFFGCVHLNRKRMLGLGITGEEEEGGGGPGKSAQGIEEGGA